MQVAQVVLPMSGAWRDAEFAPLQAIRPSLVLAFGSVGHFADKALGARLAALFPGATLAGCSTAGEISSQGVAQGSLCVTAVAFSSVTCASATTRLASMEDSRGAGERLGEALSRPGLRSVLVFGPGVSINGSALVQGVASRVGAGVPITGGLAGDDGAFRTTYTVARDGVASDCLVAVGFYGESLQFGHGSFGGWEPFGPSRKVTRCAGNVLYELDGEPALEVYKRYLGEYARDLPASGLLFPFEMLGRDGGSAGLIRTILGVSDADGSLTLAGEIDPNGYLRLMHASTDKLVDGAEAAADAASRMFSGAQDGLVLLVSCVGRKLVMGDRVDEEVEAVGDVFGGHATLAGFYSYGEISPFAPGGECRLHNQTMTITCFGES